MNDSFRTFQEFGPNGECGPEGHGFADRRDAEHFAGTVFSLTNGEHRVVIKDRENRDREVWVNGSEIPA